MKVTFDDAKVYITELPFDERMAYLAILIGILFIIIALAIW